MTQFLDGPAAGVTLMLKRAPFFLRAVRGPAGDWDALDQLDDHPSADEIIALYQLEGAPGRMHLQQSVKGRRVCGWYEYGQYRAVTEPPDDATLRDRAAWRAWAFAHAPAEYGGRA